MKINIYALQTDGKTTREEKIDVQQWPTVWRYQKLEVNGQPYQVRDIRNTKHPRVIDVICLEMPTDNRPGRAL